MTFSFSSFVGGCVLGGVVVSLWFLIGSATVSPRLISDVATTSITSALLESTSLIIVKDQSAGSGVLIDAVNAPPPGIWIAVREINGNQLGNVLGASRVSSPHDNVEVSLLRNTVPQKTYAVELYRDDNDGVFDVGSNSVYIDFDSSAPAIARFNTVE